MRRLRRFARLSGREKFLLLRALVVVCVIRVGLWLLPIGTVRRMGLRTGEKGKVAHSVNGLVWAVKAASRCVPAASCLTQALALQWLLVRSGHLSRVHIGVKKSAGTRFEAHAWVECNDRVLIGGPEAHDYIFLAAWETRP